MRIKTEPKPEFGLYRVTGQRAYRGHARGEEFIARLDRLAESRAVARGDIALIERMTPELQPGSFSFPAEWLTTARKE